MPERKRNLLIVEASSSALDGLKELNSCGEFRVTFASRKKPSEEICELVDESILVDTNNIAGLVARFQGARLDGVLTLLEWYVPAVEALRTSLGLPHNGTDSALVCRDKERMRDYLRGAFVPIPRYYFCYTVKEARSAVRAVGRFPVVVKPVDGTGSSSVRVVSDMEQLEQACRLILSETTNNREQPLRSGFLVEEYIDGREFAIDTLTVCGKHTTIAVHEYEMSSLPYATELAYFGPPKLNEDELCRLTAVVGDTIDAVGITVGPSHCEIKWGESGPRVIEIASRFGGAHIPELVRATSGFRYIVEGAKAVCGDTASPSVVHDRGGATQHLFPTVEGTVKGIKGVEDLVNTEGFVAIHFEGPGRAVSHTIEDYRSAVGHLLVTAPTARQALDQARTLATMIEIEVEP